MARSSEATPPGGRRQAKQKLWDGDDSELDVFAAERYFNGDDALWCAGSSSSFSSAFRTGATHERDRSVPTATAATSSSEASWNSRSALLPYGKLLATAVDPSVVESEPRETGRNRHRGKPSPPPSHLRRWLLGVAGCAACISGDGEEWASADDLSHEEVEDGNVVDVGGKSLFNGPGELFQRAESKEFTVADTTYVKVRSGRWLDDGDEFLAGKAAFPPVQVQLAGDRHHRAADSCELSTPILKPATSAALSEQRRKSSEMRWPIGGTGSALGSTKQDSVFTIVAGNTSRGGGLQAATAGGGIPAAQGRRCVSRCDSSEVDAAPGEPWCAYPPSEASVVWSVVTAEGAASCNFSSAASGYYCHLNDGEESALRHAAGRSDWRRRGGVTNSGGFLTCMGDKAVNAVGPARRRLGLQSGDRSAHSRWGYPDITNRR